MVRAEVPALSRAVPQDGNELDSMENLKHLNKPIRKIYFSLLGRGEKKRYARLQGEESPPPIFSGFRNLLDCSFRIANFGLLTSGSPTCWQLEIVVKPRNVSFATVALLGTQHLPGTRLLVHSSMFTSLWRQCTSGAQFSRPHLGLGLVDGGDAAARTHVGNHGSVAANDQPEPLGLCAAVDNFQRAACQLLLQRRSDTKRNRSCAAPATGVGEGSVVDEALLADKEGLDVSPENRRHDGGGVSGGSARRLVALVCAVGVGA
jgi:hypothetical protein